MKRTIYRIAYIFKVMSVVLLEHKPNEHISASVYQSKIIKLNCCLFTAGRTQSELKIYIAPPSSFPEEARYKFFKK